MEKIIEIDIIDKHDLVEKYNSKNLSKELIDYIIKESAFITKKDNIKLIINDKTKNNNIVEIVKNGLKKEYNQSLTINHITNIRQILLLILGVIFLLIYATIKAEIVWKEILLIIGWVPIWEVVDIELFADLENKRKRQILKKLLTSEIIIKN